jgi:small-conductance mechanosensitive channel
MSQEMNSGNEKALTQLAINHFLEGFSELDLHVKELPEKLRESIEAIRKEIDNLPDAIDAKTESLREASIALHDEFQQSKGEVKEAFSNAKELAITQIREELKTTTEAVNKTVDAAHLSIQKISSDAESVINDTLKKPLKNYNHTVDDIAKKLDFSIKNAFNKSTKNLLFKVTSIVVISQAIQVACWGFFIYLLKS